MLPDIAVVVPTYWTREGGVARAGDAVYDHPTAVDQDGTLGRLLGSLRRLDTDRFYVLILVAVTDPLVEDQARAKVDGIVGAVTGLTTLVVSQRDLPAMIGDSDEDLASTLLGMEQYSRVRNVQLAVPQILGTRAVVGIDDDEVVVDPGFLDEALGHLETTVDGRIVEGVGGYYLQEDTGTIFLQTGPKSDPTGNIFDRKAELMNEATEKLQRRAGSLVPTPFCFGGNMIFSRSLFSSVCFDPFITRGEDVDYLINARLTGRWFFMNKRLSILHQPPSGGSYRDVAYHKVVQDVLRFVYEREKVAAAPRLGTDNLRVEDLMPYPGAFLTSRLDGDAEEVLDRIWATLDPGSRERLGLGSSIDSFMNEARYRAREGISQYAKVQAAWARLMVKLQSASTARDYLLTHVKLAGEVAGRAPV